MFPGDVVVALTLLTRLPVAWLAPPHDTGRIAQCLWAFPVVGFVVGAFGSLAYSAGYWFGLPPLLAATWTIVAMLLMTGALHEDGLADTVDGFGGGATRVRKLEIMRDSRIGTYGALSLAVCLAVRIIAVASLAEPWAATKGLVLAGILGRGGMLVLVLTLDPARDDGLASDLGSRDRWTSGLGFAIAAAACFLCLPPLQSLAIIALTGVICLGLANLARRQVGGYTGDVLGASEVVVECVILTALVSLTK